MRPGDIAEQSEREAESSPEVPPAPASPAFRLLEVRSVSKRFGSLRALDNVSLGIRRGETLGLIGPNGAGKTTLFECLAGVLPADTGTVLWNGLPVAPARRKDVLFFLPDQIVPWADQPAGRVLSLFARAFDADPARLARLAGSLGLARFLSENVGSLSRANASASSSLSASSFRGRSSCSTSRSRASICGRPGKSRLSCAARLGRGGRSSFRSTSSPTPAASATGSSCSPPGESPMKAPSRSCGRRRA